MTYYTFWGRGVNSVHTDLLPSIAGQLICCASQQLDGHDASATSNDQDSPAITSKEEVVGVDWTGSAILKYTITTTACQETQLDQAKPRIKSTFTCHTNWSLTDSLESYQNRAWKETVILRRNNREPTVEVVWHLLQVLSAQDIASFRTKVFRYLNEHAIESVVVIELTRGIDGKPNNTVHFHFLIDDQRSEQALRKLFNTACLRSGLSSEDFRIDYRLLWDGYRYFNYFTKFGYSNKVILFRKDIGLQKFYQIGKWFRMSKKQIWKDYICERYSIDSDKIDRSADDFIPETGGESCTFTDHFDV